MFSVDSHRFMFAGGIESFTETTVFKVFNSLAKSGWEPYLYYEDGGIPTWLMRRLTV
jgi:hypothetical protein